MILEDQTHDLMGHILTVHGPVAAADMGLTLPHEHLLTTHQGPLINTADPVVAREELQRAARYGVRTLIDLTDIGVGRDPIAIRDIAAWTGVQVVMGTGFYKDGWLPAYVHKMSIDEMAKM